VRARVVIAVVLVVVAGCGSGGDAGENSGSGDGSAEAASRIERCVERFLERAASDGLSEEEVRQYIESAYCSRFEREGWIYDDGTLSITAHVVFVEAGSAEECVTAESGEEAETVPCEELEGGDGPLVLDCATLHVVRRSEVRDYVEELERSREVSCDDGTPLDRLGARP
jgi:hypothetical protein